MRFGLDSESKLLAETIRSQLSACAADAAAENHVDCLEEIGIDGIDLREGEGLLGALAAAGVAGSVNVPLSLGDYFVGRGVLDEATETLRSQAIAAGPADVYVGNLLGPSIATVTHAFAQPPVGYLLSDADAAWCYLSGSCVSEEVGAFNPSFPTRILRWDSSQQLVALPTVFPWRTANLLLHTADLLGACRWMFDRTIEFVRDRRQFGKPIGSFQAIQHRLVDLYAQIEAAHAIMLYAGWKLATLEASSSSEAACWVAAAQGHAAEMGLRTVKECMQLHGGIAVTDEFWIHRWSRRIMQLVLFNGKPEIHFKTVATGLLDGVELRAVLG